MKHEMIQQTEVIVMGRVAGKRKEESKATGKLFSIEATDWRLT